MVTIDYSEVLEGTCDLIGVATTDLQTALGDRLRRILDNRLGLAWRSRFWPDTVRVEERHFRDEYEAIQEYDQLTEVWHFETGKYWVHAGDVEAQETPGAGDYWAEIHKTYTGNDWATGNYSAGTVVRYPVDGKSYFCWKDTTASQNPSSTDYWCLLTPFESYVLLNQSEQTRIGLVKACWNKDLRLFLDATELRWTRQADRITVLEPYVSSAWVEFQLRAPRLKGSAYSASTAYQPDTFIYFSNNFYKCLLVTNAGQSPTTAPLKWEMQGIPMEFQSYLQHAAYADWLLTDGQNDRHLAELALAEQFLAQAALQYGGLQSQTNPTRVQTR